MSYDPSFSQNDNYNNLSPSYMATMVQARGWSNDKHLIAWAAMNQTYTQKKFWLLKQEAWKAIMSTGIG